MHHVGLEANDVGLPHRFEHVDHVPPARAGRPSNRLRYSSPANSSSRIAPEAERPRHGEAP